MANISNNMQQLAIANYINTPERDKQRKQIIEGLTSKRKYIPSTFLYDEYGSQLFEEITNLPEYYPPQKEIAILKNIAYQINGSFQNVDIIELGSGDCSKISVLLDSILPNHRGTVRYFPLDVCPEAIKKASNILLHKYPHLRIHGIVADFHTQLNFIPKHRKRIFCFFGSTLGNFSRTQAKQFITELSNNMQKDDILLLGLDMVKEKETLERAYNDRKNVTARFNRNILNVTNKDIITNFNPQAFEHIALYNDQYLRMEMHLKAKKNIKVTSPYINTPIYLRKGETIHTENSHKFTNDSIQDLALTANLNIHYIFTDPNKWFSIVQLVK